MKKEIGEVKRINEKEEGKDMEEDNDWKERKKNKGLKKIVIEIEKKDDMMEDMD